MLNKRDRSFEEKFKVRTLDNLKVDAPSIGRARTERSNTPRKVIPRGEKKSVGDSLSKQQIKASAAKPPATADVTKNDGGSHERAR